MNCLQLNETEKEREGQKKEEPEQSVALLMKQTEEDGP